MYIKPGTKQKVLTCFYKITLKAEHVPSDKKCFLFPDPVPGYCWWKDVAKEPERCTPFCKGVKPKTVPLLSTVNIVNGDSPMFPDHLSTVC